MTVEAPVRIGVQTPRLLHTPPGVVSCDPAEDVIEMAAEVGMPLDEWQCFVLRNALGEDERGRWSAFESALVVPRQAGKSALLEALILTALFVWEERLVVFSAHRFDTAQEIFNRLRDLIGDAPSLAPEVKKVYTANGKESIILKSGCRVKFMARSRGSGVGFTGDRLIFDEAYDLPPKMMGNMIPTLAARSMREGSNPQVWYASSAPHADSLVLHSIRNRALSGDGGRLAYCEWSAPDSASNEDVDAWYQANPALGIRISEDFVRDEYVALSHSPNEFARERLGIPDMPALAAMAAKIPADRWKMTALASASPPPRTLAFDVSTDGKWGTVGWAGGSLSDPWVEDARHERGTAWIPLQLVKMQSDYDAKRIAWDASGAAKSIVPAIREAFKAAGLDPEVLQPMMTSEYAAACGAFLADIVEGDRPRLRRRPVAGPLDVAVENGHERVVGGSWVWDDRSVSVPVSPLKVVTIARALLGDVSSKSKVMRTRASLNAGI